MTLPGAKDHASGGDKARPLPSPANIGAGPGLSTRGQGDRIVEYWREARLDYSRARASIGFKRDAARAGIKPKTIPIIDEVMTAASTASKE